MFRSLLNFYRTGPLFPLFYARTFLWPARYQLIERALVKEVNRPFYSPRPIKRRLMPLRVERKKYATASVSRSAAINQSSRHSWFNVRKEAVEKTFRDVGSDADLYMKK